MKQVKSKKYEFEYGGMSRLILLSGFSGPLEFLCMEENKYFSMDFYNTTRKQQIETLKKNQDEPVFNIFWAFSENPMQERN